ncbi:hypothetical protein GGS21DRAFT_485637 [Xylaria nigripes]|nr:hypothetical protein GGS21DRAFT_485637 [Xylaria nigripes]
MADQSSPLKQVAEGDNKMTAADAKFFATMFKYLPKGLSIPWDDFAKEMNLKNGAVARTRCRQIRTKLGHFGPGTGNEKTDAGPSPTKTLGNTKVTKASPRKRGKQAKLLSEPADEDVIKADIKEEEDMTEDEHGLV